MLHAIFENVAPFRIKVVLPRDQFYERHLRRSRNILEQLVVLKYRNFWLKFCDLASFNRKWGYFSPTSCSGVSCSNTSVSYKIVTRYEENTGLYQCCDCRFDFVFFCQVSHDRGEWKTFFGDLCLDIRWEKLRLRSWVKIYSFRFIRS